MKKMMIMTILLKNRRERRATYFQKKTFTLNTFAFTSINLDGDLYDGDGDGDDDTDDDDHSALALARIWGSPVDSEIYSTESARNLTNIVFVISSS